MSGRTVLLDTHVWLWLATEPGRLNAQSRELLADPDTTVLLSAASSWEMAIKYRLGKLPMPEDPARYVPSRCTLMGIEPIAVEHSHALHVATLPDLHSDPFDRLLVAQAQVMALSIVTADPKLGRYEVAIIEA